MYPLAYYSPLLFVVFRRQKYECFWSLQNWVVFFFCLFVLFFKFRFQAVYKCRSTGSSKHKQSFRISDANCATLSFSLCFLFRSCCLNSQISDSERNCLISASQTYQEMVYFTRSNSPKQQPFVLGVAAENRPNSLCMMV